MSGLKNSPVVTVRSTEGLDALSIYFADGKIPSVGQKFCLECFEVSYGDGQPASIRLMLSPIAEDSTTSPVIYRYLRPQDYGSLMGSPSNLGGITFAFMIDYAKNTVFVGTAICDDDWNFNKAEGRRIALESLNKSPFTVAFDPRISLVNLAAEKVFADKALRAKNPKLAKVLFRTFADRLGK